MSALRRLGLFIDGAHLQAASRALGFSVDFKSLLSLFRARGALVRALYHAALTEDESSGCALRPLIDWLQYNGYTTRTKVAKGAAAAAAVDVMLTIDALRLGSTLDDVVLISGSENLSDLVCALQEQGRRVTVVSTLAKSVAIADELRRQADEFIDLADLKMEISLGPRAPLSGGRDQT